MLISLGLEEVEDRADLQSDEVSQAWLNSVERRTSAVELEASAAVHVGCTGTSSERIMDPATTGPHRIGATAGTLKFRGTVSHEGISS